MQAFPIALWMLRRVGSTPIGWLWLLGSLASVPLLVGLTPQGVVGHPEDSPDLACQLAFLSSMLGAMLALAGLARSDWMLELCSTGRKWSAQVCGLLTASLLGACLVALGSWSSVGHGAPVGIGALLTMFLAACHLTAMGTALLQIPSAPTLLPIGIPLLGWLLPASLPVGVLRWLPDLLRAHRNPVSLQDWTPAGFLASIGPILVWAGLSWFLAQRRSSSLRLSSR